ncbi:hypothetical protein GQR58_029355 [Nymphon striatum]|nr:hypothetical protein GQR58_029355 [Nymphon striatum]
MCHPGVVVAGAGLDAVKCGTCAVLIGLVLERHELGADQFLYADGAARRASSSWRLSFDQIRVTEMSERKLINWYKREPGNKNHVEREISNPQDKPLPRSRDATQSTQIGQILKLLMSRAIATLICRIHCRRQHWSLSSEGHGRR